MENFIRFTWATLYQRILNDQYYAHKHLYRISVANNPNYITFTGGKMDAKNIFTCLALADMMKISEKTTGQLYQPSGTRIDEVI